MPVLKRKLSRKSLDEFVLKYSRGQPYKGSLPYTTADGKGVIFCPSDALLGDGIQEFNYFLAQTFPYHDRQNLVYPLADLAFIMTEDKTKVFWSGKGAKTRQEAQAMIKNDTALFAKVGMSMAAFVVSHNCIVIDQDIEPIVHKENN